MNFPLTLLQISIWLGFLALMLILTIEAMSYLGIPTRAVIDRSRLRLLLLSVSLLFLAVIVLRIYGILG